MVKGKGGDERADGGSVHDEKQRTENGALGNTTGGGAQGRKGVITSDTEGARWHIKRKLNTFLTTLIDGSEKEVESTKKFMQPKIAVASKVLQRLDSWQI